MSGLELADPLKRDIITIENEFYQNRTWADSLLLIGLRQKNSAIQTRVPGGLRMEVAWQPARISPIRGVYDRIVVSRWGADKRGAFIAVANFAIQGSDNPKVWANYGTVNALPKPNEAHWDLSEGLPIIRQGKDHPLHIGQLVVIGDEAEKNMQATIAEAPNSTEQDVINQINPSLPTVRFEAAGVSHAA